MGLFDLGGDVGGERAAYLDAVFGVSVVLSLRGGYCLRECVRGSPEVGWRIGNVL